MKKLITLIIGFAFLFIVGCKNTQQFVIPDATVYDVSRILEDFVGLNGFRITYSNATVDRASYRIYVGTTVRTIPGEVETTYQRDTYGNSQRDKDTDSHTYNRSGYSTIRTTETPPEQVITNWSFSIQMIQMGEQVRFLGSAVGGFNPGKYLNQFKEFLQYQGYQFNKDATLKN